METKTPLQEIIDEFNISSEPNFCFWLSENSRRLLRKEKQMIVDAVNLTNKINVKMANRAVIALTGKKATLFVHSEESGEKYYNDNFSN